jgi:signal transduction histidine kinase/streptogramin lyase
MKLCLVNKNNLLNPEAIKPKTIRSFIYPNIQTHVFLKNTFTYLCFVLLLVSCRGDKQSAGVELPLLFPVPQSMYFAPLERYLINPVSGNSIQPLVNSLGDTLRTGISVPVEGKAIPPGSVANPKIIVAGQPEVIPHNLDVSILPGAPKIVPLNTRSQLVFTPGMDSSSYVLVNSTGDTVQSGIPLPISGVLRPCFLPKAIKALPPRMKDNTSIHMQYLDVAQGMNSSHVLSILEDSHGNLWFGTGGGGVTMYNGNTFIHFTEKEGLGNSIVWDIVEDRRGNLWFGTYGGGVSMYDGKNFTHFTEKEGLSDNHIRSMMEDSQGNIWLGTWNGGVSKYTGETITHFTEREGFVNYGVNTISEDSQGHLWFGTEGGGVISYDGHSFTHFTENEGLANNSVRSILEDSSGHLWFGTGGGGVIKFDQKNFTLFSVKEGLSHNSVRCILEDRHGNLWFGTEGGGLSMYNGESFRHFTENDGLSNNSINTIYEDGHGNLWFGTEYGGVSKYNGESFTHFTEKEGLTDNRIRSILLDRQGDLWFGSWKGGVSRYHEGVISHFGREEGLSDRAVNTIFEDSQGSLWFGTAGDGVISYNRRTFTHFTENAGLSNNDVRSILEDSQGNLWFGTWGGGVNRYNGQAFTHFTEREGLSSNYVRTILEDGEGRLYFGTYGGGVSMLNGKTITVFTEREGLSHNIVLSLLEDKRGNLWFGTYGGGVSMYRDGSITHITEKEGLSNDIVQSLLEDRDGNIWVSTEKGLNLMMFEPDTLQEGNSSPKIRTYGLQDGLKGMDFILNSVLLDRTNRIWWGSSKSLTMVDMDVFKVPVDPPDILLNNIEINEQFADYKNLELVDRLDITFDSVADFYNYPLVLELPFKKNHLTFHFSGIDWSAPHKIKYSYRMEGFHDNWSAPSEETTAEYRKLPPGSYTFKVRAIGGAQKWSESFDYSFAINPPWWSAWWAWTGYILSGLLLVLGVIRWRTINLMRHKKELEKEVAFATEQIREQKEEIENQRDEVMATNEALGTQKKELELTLENLRSTQSQLIQSEKMASVGLLTAGIAHELNNPINFVSGNVNPLKRDLDILFSIIEKYDKTLEAKELKQVIREIDQLKESLDFSFLSKEIMSLLEGIEEGAIRTSTIVKGLRSFSRLDEDKCQFYDIHEGIDSTLILLQNKIKDRIKIRKEYGDFEEVECFPSKFNQVILNILNNSIQAIEGQGEILIQTIRSGIGIKIIIKDNGRGMSPEVKEHIFEPFFTTKEVGEGTGLGLAISFGIIEQHQGNIDVISEPGEGTEFIISLPLRLTREE